MGGRESLLPYNMQTTLCARLGPVCRLREHAPHAKSGAPSRAEAGGHLSRFPVPELGGAWLGPLWPNREAGFGPQHVAL